MSEPMRFDLKHFGQISTMEVAKDGEFVLHSDYAHLKAEVERLKEGNDCLGQMHDKEMERSAYLLEEFNRTTAWGRGLESDLSHARVEISFLKAEVKRLSAADSYLQDANEHAFEKRCDELEAEVERLKAQFSRLESVDENELGLTVPRRLVLFWMYRAKRLYKAGDAMSEVIQTIDHERFECYPQYRMTTKERNACDAWSAAKKGTSTDA